jgi:hypothetical protein
MKVNIGKFPKDDSKERKISIKIDDFDSWNCDITFAMIAVPLLKQLQGQKQGVPSFCLPDFECDDIALKIGSDKWDNILRHMIWSFEQILDEEYEIFGMYQFGTNWHAYWAYLEKIDEGLILFGEHFRSLWS